MLRAFGRTLFDHSVGTFAQYFDSTPFLFVTLKSAEADVFVRDSCKQLGIRNARVVSLDAPTRGQAETVYLGMERAGVGDGPLTIFNIDTAEVGFQQPSFVDRCDGYLDVFRATGDHWSFVRPEAPGSWRVAETAEKRRISDLCSTGLYHFASASEFAMAYGRAVGEFAQGQLPELYVAPLYNHLISEGRDVRYREVPAESVVLFGTPSEYGALLSARRSPFGGASSLP
jgi:hypothetical protein